MQRLTSVQGAALLTGILPTPRIRQIKLSYSPLPPKVNNPHIDHVRETIVYKDRAGKQKLRHSGFTINKDPRNLLVEVSVVLMDNIKSNGQSNWVYEEDLVKYMNLQLIHCEDPEFTKRIMSKQVTPVPSEINRERPNNNRVIVETRSLANMAALEGFYGEEAVEPGTKEMVIKFSFAVNTINPEHLTYFANVYFDVEQMVNDYSLNLSKEMLFTSCGDTVVEAVYKKGSHVGTAKMYTVQGTSKLYTGAVYKVGPNRYTPAASLNDNLIRRDMLQILATISQSSYGSSSSQYKKHIEDIVKKDSSEMTKYEEVKKMLASWKKRSTNTMSGRIYQMVHDRVMIYDQIIKNKTKLTAMTVSNSTIKDERTIEELSLILPVEPVAEEDEVALSDIRSQNYNTTAKKSATNVNNSRYFSRCMMSRDSGASCRLGFIVNWRRLAIESSSHRALIERSSEQIKKLLFSKITLNGMRLIRERYDDQNIVEQFDRHMTRDRESIVEVIADASLEKESMMLSGQRSVRSRTSTEQKRIGTLKEIRIDSITSNSIRAFEAQDYAISRRKAGKFRYRVELQYVDKIGDFLYGKVAELRRAKRKISDYYNMSSLACNYDEVSDKFSEFYVSGLYEKYAFPNPDIVAGMSQQEISVMMQGNSIADAPWISPIAKYVEILQIVAALSPANANTLAKKIYLQIEPSFATPDSILAIIDKFEKLEQQIVDMILTNEPGTSSYLSDNSKIARKLTKSQNLNYTFLDIYDNKTLSNIGASYLYYDQEINNGLPRITKGNFLKRMAEEEARFYKNQPSASRVPVQDMQTYRYSYIAPAEIKVGAKKLLLLNRGAALFEPEQYKEMMFSISLLQTNPAARSMTMPVLDFAPGSFDTSTTADMQAAKMNMAATTLLATYGISVEAQTPYLTTRMSADDPLLEVTSVLGENTLLAIQNAIATDIQAETESDLSADEMSSVTPDKQVNYADITAIASSLVSTLASTGLQNFMGTTSPHSQISRIDESSRQQQQFAKTLEFFDLANPRNAIDSQVTNTTGPDSMTKIRKIPNQVKSLFLAKTGQVTPAKEWHTMEVDPIASPDTRPLFELLYFNLQKIEVLKGFKSSNVAGKPLMKAANYELLNESHLAGKGNLLCRMSRYRNDSLHIGDSEFLDLPVYSEYFILELSSNRVAEGNKIVEAGLYTAGGEYQTPDGTNYIGYYHIHKDKTVMSGKDMTEEGVVLRPYDSMTSDKGVASALMTKRLAPSMSEMEAQVTTTILTEHYTQKDVKTDYCVTEDTIPAVGVEHSMNGVGGVF